MFKFRLHAILILVTLIISGCDLGPRDRRTRSTFNSPLDTSSSTYQKNFGSTDSQNGVSSTPNNSTTTNNTNSTNTTTNDNAYINTPGFGNCPIRVNSIYQYNNPTIGQMSVCQNLQDETIIRLKFAKDEVSGRTCVFPTFRDHTNRSFYLGSAECFTHNSNQIIDIKLYKNRGGYFNEYPINGVMVMKKDLIYQYVDCMNEMDPYIMWDKCTKFKNTQGYLDISL